MTFTRTCLPAHIGIWQSPLPIGHICSLNVEEQSYLLLSVLTLIALLRARQAWILMAAGVLAIVVHVVYIKYSMIAPPSGELGTEVSASHLLLSAGYFLIRRQVIPWIHSWIPIAAFVGAMNSYSPWVP